MKIKFKRPFLGYKDGEEVDNKKDWLDHKDEGCSGMFGIESKDLQTLIECGIVEEVKEEPTYIFKNESPVNNPGEYIPYTLLVKEDHIHKLDDKLKWLIENKEEIEHMLNHFQTKINI